MVLSPLVQGVIAYVKDHYPTTREQLNLHVEVKAASQQCLSDDYRQVVMKKVPVDDCWLNIAATETQKTWKEKKKDLPTINANKMDNDSDSSDEHVDKQLRGVSGNP